MNLIRTDHDKSLHANWGSLTYLVLLTLLGLAAGGGAPVPAAWVPELALSAVALIGIGWELWQRERKTGVYDLRDAVATVSGALVCYAATAGARLGGVAW